MMEMKETIENALRYLDNILGNPHEILQKPEESIENRYIRNMMERHEGEK